MSFLVGTPSCNVKAASHFVAITLSSPWYNYHQGDLDSENKKLLKKDNCD